MHSYLLIYVLSYSTSTLLRGRPYYNNYRDTIMVDTSEIPTVYYLHKVYQSCNTLVHGIVLQRSSDLG